MNSNELRRDKLYLLELEYTIETDTGKIIPVQEKCVGYITGCPQIFFYGAVFHVEERHYEGGDTVEMTKAEFDEWVKSVKEIA